MFRLRALLVCAIALCVTAVSAAAAGGGGLAQLPGKRGCVGEGAGAECAHARKLAHATGIAISPDGRNVYTTSFTGPVAAFVRGSDGALRQLAGDRGLRVRAARLGLHAGAGAAARHDQRDRQR